jgi:hypothetical protein
MTEIIKTDIAPGPVRRKTEKAIKDQGGNPVILAYDEVNDRTVMVRGDISGGLRVIGMMYDPSEGEYIPGQGATQGGVNKAFINTDHLEDLMSGVIEQLRILNVHMASMTDMDINKQDLGDE